AIPGGANFGIPTFQDGTLRFVSIDTTGGVPEPATWAMMILGFGGIGAVLRRRRVLGATA
ncbi:MAG TPA: PEPxxWA-CTERM sorting domain-containing protein, partial [Phenylobacterium sp.]